MNLADKGVIEFPMSGLSYDKSKDWANYFMGVVDVFEKAGHKAGHGFDIVIHGTLPGGAGLSSSASTAASWISSPSAWARRIARCCSTATR